MSENDISKHGQPDGQNLPFHLLIKDAPQKVKNVYLGRKWLIVSSILMLINDTSKHKPPRIVKCITHFIDRKRPKNCFPYTREYPMLRILSSYGVKFIIVNKYYPAKTECTILVTGGKRPKKG